MRAHHDHEHHGEHGPGPARPHRRGALWAGAGVLAASLLGSVPGTAPTAAASVAAAAGQAGRFAGTPPRATAQDTAPVTVTRRGARPSQAGPAEQFTGAVRVTPLFDTTDATHAAGALVTFQPGARTAWHTHPRGQTLIVTAGVGRVQSWGGPVAEIRPGDVVRIPPGAKHWHGAAPATAMTDVAIQEALDGKVVEWMEHVTDAQYGAPHRNATRSSAMRGAIPYGPGGVRVESREAPTPAW